MFSVQTSETTTFSANLSFYKISKHCLTRLPVLGATYMHQTQPLKIGSSDSGGYVKIIPKYIIVVGIRI